MIKGEKDMRGYETCADCKHNVYGYCDVYGRMVRSSTAACPEFEEI